MLWSGLQSEARIDTNNCMNLSTRERIIQAATDLFAESGFRGASVRDICNLAGANPGAVSYHFGGKRQLYRAVLRRAAAELAGIGTDTTTEPEIDGPPASPADVMHRVLLRAQDHDSATRLLLRDLADGGSVAVEALTPPLRSAFEQLSAALGEGDSPHGTARGRRLFIGLAAPLFLLTAGWPVIARALDLDIEQRDAILGDLVQRVLAADDGFLAT